MSPGRAFLQRLSSRAIPPAILLVVVIMIDTRLSGLFLVPANLSDVVTSVIEIGIVAIPMTFLVTGGEIDLSVASSLALSAAVLAKSVEMGYGVVSALLMCLATGALCGLVNGLLVVKLGLNSIVVTIGTLALLRGIASILLTDQTVSDFPASLVGWDLKFIPGTYVTGPQVTLVAAVLVAGVVLGVTSVGRRVQFIGGSRGVATFSGVHVDRVRVALFVASGVAAAVAALTLVSRLQSVRNDIGQGLELTVVTAVLIGGTDIRGGRGTILGTIVAVLAIGSVRSGLGLANVPDEARGAVIGALLVLSISISVGRGALERRVATRRSRRRLPPREPAAEPVTA